MGSPVSSASTCEEMRPCPGQRCVTFPESAPAHTLNLDLMYSREAGDLRRSPAESSISTSRDRGEDNPNLLPRRCAPLGQAFGADCLAANFGSARAFTHK